MFEQFHSTGEVLGASVRDVVAIDGSQDDVVDSPFGDRFSGLECCMVVLWCIFARCFRIDVMSTNVGLHKATKYSFIMCEKGDEQCRDKMWGLRGPTPNTCAESKSQKYLGNARTLNGSNGSGSGGFPSVFTAQNMHPLVHVSPSSMIVPVPPFQHSPMLGHCASSHTVFSDRSFSDSLTFW